MSEHAAPDMRIRWDEGRRRRPVVTPEGVPLVFQVARAGERAAAFVLDVVFLIAGVLVIGLAASLTGFAGVGHGVITAFVIVVQFVLVNFYFVFFEVRWQGQTPGKRLMKLRVIESKGGSLSGEAIFARNVTRNIEFWIPMQVLQAPDQAFPGAPGWALVFCTAWVVVFLFFPLFNRDHLRIGDLIAGTMVVAAPRAVLLPDMTGRVLQRRKSRSSAIEFTTEQLDIYGEFELQVLEDLLRRGQTDRRRLGVVAEKIKKKIDWQETADFEVSDLKFLQRFYAAQRARLEQKMLLGRRRRHKADDGTSPGS